MERAKADQMKPIQYLRQHDSSFDWLLCYIHALRHGRHTQKLPPVRLPLGQLLCANRPRIQIPELLEVSLAPLPFPPCFSFILLC